MFLDAFADRFHHFEVDGQQVIPAHPWFAGHAGGDDANIGPAQKGIIVGAGNFGIKAFGWP